MDHFPLISRQTMPCQRFMYSSRESLNQRELKSGYGKKHKPFMETDKSRQTLQSKRKAKTRSEYYYSFTFLYAKT